MRPLAYLAALLSLGGCLQIGQDPSTDGGADGGPASTSDAGSSAGAAVGSDCAQDQLTGAVLCAQSTVCPGLRVERDRFPNCGYRINGTAIDLQCDCQGALCSMGVAATCDDAARLLAEQSEMWVCAQVNEGRCLGEPIRGGGAGESKCDRACASDCAGVPTCLQMCGC